MPTDRTNRHGKKRAAAEKFNRKNHTHFKVFNSTKRGGFNSAHPMLVGVTRKIGREHRRYQLDLLHDQFGVRSIVFKDLMKQLKDKGLTTSIFTGAKGIPSANTIAYLQHLLNRLIDEHKIVQVFEVVDTDTTTVTNRHGRYRYLKNTIPARSIEELRKVKVASTTKIRYCIKCIQSLLH